MFGVSVHACVCFCLYVRVCLLHPKDLSHKSFPAAPYCLTITPYSQLSVNMWVNALNPPAYLSGSAALKESPVEERNVPAGFCSAFDVWSPGRAAAESLNFLVLCSITF